MSDGHGDGGCVGGGQANCLDPVNGNLETAYVQPSPTARLPVVNGIEVNRAKIVELAKQRPAVPHRQA